MKHLRGYSCVWLLSGLSIFANRLASVEQNPRTLKLLEIWNKGNLALIDEIYAANYVRHFVNMHEDVVGLKSFKAWVSSTRTTYPDFNFMVDEEVDAADRIIYRWSIRATNTGPGDFPPTGKRITFSGCSILRIADGKIAEEWVYFNQTTILLQLALQLCRRLLRNSPVVICSW